MEGRTKRLCRAREPTKCSCCHALKFQLLSCATNGNGSPAHPTVVLARQTPPSESVTSTQVRHLHPSQTPPSESVTSTRVGHLHPSQTPPSESDTSTHTSATVVALARRDSRPSQAFSSLLKPLIEMCRSKLRRVHRIDRLDCLDRLNRSSPTWSTRPS